MIFVHRPEIEDLGDGTVKLKAVFEVNSTRGEMWYSTSVEFAQYLCHERGDAFILPMLFYAMKRNLPVRMEAPISERLYYTITNYLAKVMVRVFDGWHEVHLDCPVSSMPLQNAGGVGTGLSCGIDSFSTIANHISERQPRGYRLTHCTFFNVGGHSPRWTDPSKTEELFRKRTDRVRCCAKELGLPLVVVDSNMEEILGRPFAATHTFRNASAVLALQKLFKTYYYSSGIPVQYFAFTSDFSCDYDMFSLPMMSTETLSFYSAGGVTNRLEKTAMVAAFPISYRYLNVCIAQDANCSMCEKCMRTMLMLDALGKLDSYQDLFNVRVFRQNREWFAGHIVACKGRHYRDTYEPLAAAGYEFGSRIRLYLAWYCHRIVDGSKRMVKGIVTSQETERFSESGTQG